MLTILKEKTRSHKESDVEGISFFLNPYSYLQLRKQKKLLQKADNIFIDGQWLCHFLRWFNVVNVERCSFDNSSVAPLVFSHCSDNKLSVAVIGSTSETIKHFSNYLQETYPKINLVFVRNGYFDDDEAIKNCQAQIVDLKVDTVIIGMGAPKQEEFLVSLKALGWSGTGYTCGGFLHQTANKGHDYYPAFFNKFNLRFLYRIWDEPKLLRRYTIDYSCFVFAFVIDFFKLNFKRVD